MSDDPEPARPPPPKSYVPITLLEGPLPTLPPRPPGNEEPKLSARALPDVFPPPCSEEPLLHLSVEPQSMSKSSSYGGGDSNFRPIKPDRHKDRKEPPKPVPPYEKVADHPTTQLSSRPEPTDASRHAMASSPRHEAMDTPKEEGAYFDREKVLPLEFTVDSAIYATVKVVKTRYAAPSMPAPPPPYEGTAMMNLPKTVQDMSDRMSQRSAYDTPSTRFSALHSVNAPPPARGHISSRSRSATVGPSSSAAAKARSAKLSQRPEIVVMGAGDIIPTLTKRPPPKPVLSQPPKRPSSSPAPPSSQPKSPSSTSRPSPKKPSPPPAKRPSPPQPKKPSSPSANRPSPPQPNTTAAPQSKRPTPPHPNEPSSTKATPNIESDDSQNTSPSERAPGRPTKSPSLRRPPPPKQPVQQGDVGRTGVKEERATATKAPPPPSSQEPDEKDIVTQGPDLIKQLAELGPPPDEDPPEIPTEVQEAPLLDRDGEARDESTPSIKTATPPLQDDITACSGVEVPSRPPQPQRRASTKTTGRDAPNKSSPPPASATKKQESSPRLPPPSGRPPPPKLSKEPHPPSSHDSQHAEKNGLVAVGRPPGPLSVNLVEGKRDGNEGGMVAEEKEESAKKVSSGSFSKKTPSVRRPPAPRTSSLRHSSGSADRKNAERSTSNGDNGGGVECKEKEQDSVPVGNAGGSSPIKKAPSVKRPPPPTQPVNSRANSVSGEGKMDTDHPDSTNKLVEAHPPKKAPAVKCSPVSRPPAPKVAKKGAEQSKALVPELPTSSSTCRDVQATPSKRGVETSEMDTAGKEGQDEDSVKLLEPKESKKPRARSPSMKRPPPPSNLKSKRELVTMTTAVDTNTDTNTDTSADTNTDANADKNADTANLKSKRELVTMTIAVDTNTHTSADTNTDANATEQSSTNEAEDAVASTNIDVIQCKPIPKERFKIHTSQLPPDLAIDEHLSPSPDPKQKKREAEGEEKANEEVEESALDLPGPTPVDGEENSPVATIPIDKKLSIKKTSPVIRQRTRSHSPIPVPKTSVSPRSPRSPEHVEVGSESLAISHEALPVLAQTSPSSIQSSISTDLPPSPSSIAPQTSDTLANLDVSLHEDVVGEGDPSGGNIPMPAASRTHTQIQDVDISKDGEELREQDEASATKPCRSLRPPPPGRSKSPAPKGSEGEGEVENKNIYAPAIRIESNHKSLNSNELVVKDPTKEVTASRKGASSPRQSKARNSMSQPQHSAGEKEEGVHVLNYSEISNGNSRETSPRVAQRMTAAGGSSKPPRGSSKPPRPLSMPPNQFPGGYLDKKKPAPSRPPPAAASTSGTKPSKPPPASAKTAPPKPPAPSTKLGPPKPPAPSAKHAPTKPPTPSSKTKPPSPSSVTSTHPTTSRHSTAPTKPQHKSANQGKPEPTGPPRLPPRPAPGHRLYRYVCAEPHGIANTHHDAADEDELPYQEGDVIELIEKVDENWFYATNADLDLCQGLVQAGHLNIVKRLPGQATVEGFEDGPCAVATATFEGQCIDELSFKSGELIMLKTRYGTDWFRGKLINGRQGIFPKNFVEVVEELPQDAYEAPPATSEPELTSVSGPPHCVATFPFSAEGPGELSISMGDDIELVGRVDQDWLKGRLKGQEGIFPANFVDIIVDLPPECREGGETTTNQGPASPIPVTEHTSTAMYDFVGKEGELSFKIGDKINVTSRVNAEWVKGKLGDLQGMFPVNFVDSVPDTIAQETDSKEREHQQELTGKCEALYEFEGDEASGELSFLPGQAIVTLEKVNDEWMKGRIGTKEGLFPVDFVKVILEIPEAVTTQKATQEPAKNKRQPLMDDLMPKGVALRDYQSGDISFKVGDMLYLLNREPQQMIMGENIGTGDLGIFPASYINVLVPLP